ncbi:protein iws1 homolog [Phtheirospermum japonicum]|uniref:Protein iws1 homolog n=1 Tax=Phtheirospermum japonicum TaxID=374723 RepID=A0A830AYT5_9LAMI|nr:protein iws1 homolog [Phtheirospermum japonicum]
MAYENEPYRDEDGEPLMDFDEDTQSDEPHQHLLDDEDDANYDRPPTPVYNDPKAKPRKRLIKKSSGKDDFSDGGKRKRGKGEKSTSAEKRRKREKLRDHEADPEMKEMWDTIAGDNSEDDQEGSKTADDDNFIDDSGLGPAEQYGSENEHSPSRAPQAEEGEEVDEIEELFKIGKKKKKNEKTAAEIALLVEEVMAELEVAAEEDHVLNTQKKPAINKLKKLPLLTDVLGKKQLQQEFLDHGVLTLLKNWLEPLPDKSLPNFNIRSAVLNILKDLPIDLEQFDRREQLKKSGLGKVVMFLSKSDEEKTVNRKLAQELVDKWSRPIFNKSTRFEGMKNFEDERVVYRRPSVKKVTSKATEHVSQDDDLDLGKFSQRQKSGQTSSSQHALRPEAMSMDFVVRPQSKVDPARSKQLEQNPQRMKMDKKLQKLKASKRKQLQARKVSVEGRGMVKYL